MEAVPPELLPLLEAAVEACSQALGASLVGVYLRGSLAQRGCFLPGVSDADFVVVHLEEQAPGEAAPGAAARLRRSAEQLRADFPHVAKVELKAAPLPHRSPLAALFRQQQKQQQQQGHDATISGVCGSKPGRGGSIAPSALHHHASLAFQLKTQAVCLHGWDLPRLLPDVAALPQLHLLPTLVQEVEAAVRDAARPGAAAPGSSADAAIRGLRWALKRCLRAAFELYLCCSSGAGSAGSSSSSSSSSSPGTVTTTTSSRVFTRDLYWCLEYAARRHPALRPQLAAALQLYVELGPEGSFGGQQMQQAGQAHQEAEQQVQRQHPEQREPPPRQQRLEEAAALAVQLAGRIDLLSTSSTTSTTTARQGAGGTAGSGAARWQRLRVRLWAATAGAGMEAELVGAPPPPVVAAAVAGELLTLDWWQEAARQQAAAIIWAAAAGQEQAVVPDEAGYCSAGTGGLAGLAPQPVLLKGAAAHWPALRRWSLRYLVAAGLEGRSRVAPSLHFPFTEPSLAVVLAGQQGVAALPSCVARMDAAELAARLQRRNPCRLPPLVYCGQGCDPLASHMIINPAGLTSEHQAGAQRPAEAAAAVAGGAGGAFQAVPEFYYFQAKLPASFLADTDLASPPFALPQGPATAGRPVPGPAPPSTGSAEPPPPPGAGLRMTQAARVWVSPQGAVSPTHYDLSHSFLTQVKGRKRMLFWSPDQLACLYCYPDSHLLRRRSRLNMHAPLAAQPGDSSFPLAVRARAVQAVLEPGDVVFFPSRWAHYTESLDFSMSVTCRFGGGRQGSEA
ncbi:hypothetical protein CHLNCDRAFT_140939 [Chlorella variabilis]|uniref:JmjC domain-containing protein n=1 Tax=Chlorella variabilis TaxID=554065 RepID=E1Z6K0_CHLVA|nr:hypothetical protein CHLNCDRAFT_140939 [Chlorella variabilis]EFN58944.1 hypothetical protein CHLNCDRAFT_140939 [Chlorella variabilis]|eukprot:XP_005851046.1 hypothetical protein CHLNCDRAFT_140939 [Chlorella variabilis]